MSVIGIDLGTANTLVAVLRQQQVHILDNEQGSRSTPSIIAFTDEERLIGDAALHQMAKNPSNTIFEFKRMLGREYDDLVFSKEKWPFHIKTSSTGATEIQIRYKHEKRSFLPEEITAMILSRMKEIAETHTGGKILGAVITVPASFNLSQRRATQQAAVIAEIPLLGLIDEPLAAAVAYGLNRNTTQKRNVLIFHLGAGTFEVMIVTMGLGLFDVKATAGSTNFGGEDLIENLCHRFVNDMKDLYQADIRCDPRAVTKLRLACKKTVKDLGLSPNASVKVDAIFHGKDFESSITREDFNKINKEHFKSMVRLVEEALEGAELEVKEIDDVVAVGGSTRMPIIHDILAEHCGFGKGKIKKTLNVDEAAVEGAAIMAGLLSGEEGRIFAVNGILSNSVKLMQDNNMIQLFPRNTRIPAMVKLQMNTVQKYPLAFKVYEDIVIVGSNQSCNVQRSLVASFRMDTLVRDFHERSIIEITFRVDLDGILHVTGPNKVKFLQNMGLQSFDIQKSKCAISSFLQEEEEHKQVMADLHRFERKIYDLQTFLEGLGDTYAKLEGNANHKCRELLTWIQETPNPYKQEVKEKEREFDQLQQQLHSARHRDSTAHDTGAKSRNNQKNKKAKQPSSTSAMRKEPQERLDFLKKQDEEILKNKQSGCKKTEAVISSTKSTTDPAPSDSARYQGTMNSWRNAWGFIEPKEAEISGMSASNARPPNSNPACNVAGHPATPRNDHQYRVKKICWDE